MVLLGVDRVLDSQQSKEALAALCVCMCVCGCVSGNVRVGGGAMCVSGGGSRVPQWQSLGELEEKIEGAAGLRCRIACPHSLGL